MLRVQKRVRFVGNKFVSFHLVSGIQNFHAFLIFEFTIKFHFMRGNSTLFLKRIIVIIFVYPFTCKGPHISICLLVAKNHLSKE